MYAILASYQEPSVIPEEILSNKQGTNSLKTEPANPQQIAVTLYSEKLHIVSEIKHSFMQLCS